MPAAAAMNTTKKAHTWTTQQDRALREAVQAAGCRKRLQWTQLAETVPGRNGKQCRSRWNDILDPAINSSQWSSAEVQLLVASAAQYEFKWSKLRPLFPGRTDNNIKNKWYSQQRKDYRQKLREELRMAEAAAAAAAAAAAGSTSTESDPVAAVTVKHEAIEEQALQLDTLPPPLTFTPYGGSIIDDLPDFLCDPMDFEKLFLY
jgi:hypothetical protein